jgi:hypothetical protein
MKKWPSTTDIIKFFGLAEDYEEFASEGVAQRGQLVHAASHMLAGGGDDPVWEARHPECHPYLEAYRKFLREHDFRLAFAEHEFKSRTLRFISHPDQIGNLDGFNSVLELKSGGLPRWVRLQTAGQVLAIDLPTIRRFALHLKANGTYRLVPHEDFRDMDRFRSMVDTWWTIQEFGNGKLSTSTRTR